MNDRDSASTKSSDGPQPSISGQPSDEIRRAVLSEATRNIVRWLLGASVGLIVLALMGWWLYLKPYIMEDLGGVPRGAILAFDRADLTQDTCPQGWSPFKEGRGRSIVGVGDPSTAPGRFGLDEKGAPLANRSLRQHGGTESHLLSPNELPPHQHPVGGLEWGYDVKGNHHPARLLVEDGPPYHGKTGKLTAGPQKESQSQAAHNNMPPYIALYLCKKN